MRQKYTITFESVGAGVVTCEFDALCKYDAIEQFVEHSKQYLGNCYSKSSIVSVERSVKDTVTIPLGSSVEEIVELMLKPADDDPPPPASPKR